MGERIDEYTVLQRGLGAPDYSNTVSSSKERKGLRLDYYQGLEIFGAVFTGIASPYPWILPVLAPGIATSLIDNMTGVALPYTIPVGYTLSVISIGAASTQDAIIYAYIDAFLVVTLGVIAGGTSNYENEVVGMTTETVDPTALTEHTLDIQITNLGLADLTGGVDIKLILEAVGTPPFPTVKTIRCKHCGYEVTVPMITTKLVCPKCKKLTMVYGYQNFGVPA